MKNIKKYIKQLLPSTLEKMDISDLRKLVKASQKNIKTHKTKLQKDGLDTYIPKGTYPKEVKNVDTARRETLVNAVQEHKAYYGKELSSSKIVGRLQKSYKDAPNRGIHAINPSNVKAMRVEKTSKKTGKTRTETQYIDTSTGQRVYRMYDEYGRLIYVTGGGKKQEGVYTKVQSKSRWKELEKLKDELAVGQYGSKIILYIYRMAERGRLTKTVKDENGQEKKISASPYEAYDRFMTREFDKDVMDKEVWDELEAKFGAQFRLL